MIFFRDRWRAPFPARAIAPCRYSAAVVQSRFRYNVHLVKIAGDIVSHLDIDHVQHGRHIVCEPALIGEAVHNDLAVEKRARGCILPTELAVEAVFWVRPVDVGHHRRGELDPADARGVANFLAQFQTRRNDKVSAELAREHFDRVARLSDAKGRSVI